MVKHSVVGSAFFLRNLSAVPVRAVNPVFDGAWQVTAEKDMETVRINEPAVRNTPA